MSEIKRYDLATNPRWFKDISTARLEHEYRTVCDYIQYWDEEAQEMPPVSFKGDPFCPMQKLKVLRMIRDEVRQELLYRSKNEARGSATSTASR